MAASLSSSVFGSLAVALSAPPPAPSVFVLPPSLARLRGVSFSAPVSVVSVTPVPGGVWVLCSDGATRQCNWATVQKFRGASSAATAAVVLLDPSLVGRSFRFVAIGGWSHSRWFAALVAA